MQEKASDVKPEGLCEDKDHWLLRTETWRF